MSSVFSWTHKNTFIAYYLYYMNIQLCYYLNVSDQILLGTIVYFRFHTKISWFMNLVVWLLPFCVFLCLNSAAGAWYFTSGISCNLRWTHSAVRCSQQRRTCTRRIIAFNTRNDTQQGLLSNVNKCIRFGMLLKGLDHEKDSNE